jgi:hypothetical protein
MFSVLMPNFQLNRNPETLGYENKWNILTFCSQENINGRLRQGNSAGCCRGKEDNNNVRTKVAINDRISKTANVLIEQVHAMRVRENP